MPGKTYAQRGSQPGDRRCSQPKFGGRRGIRYGQKHFHCRHALQSCLLNTAAVSQEAEAWMHQKMIWTARSVQNKARLSTGGQTDTEQVYPWRVQGVVGSTMPQTCGKTMVTFAVAT